MFMCAGITLERSVLERLADMTEAAGAWLVRHDRGIQLNCAFPLLAPRTCIGFVACQGPAHGDQHSDQHVPLGCSQELALQPWLRA